MTLTTEQQAKVKEAVKNKLLEMGAYVVGETKLKKVNKLLADQLEDYVMIMITNKKTEKQMSEDLELFLGGIEQAVSFSTWLHSFIKNLNEKEVSSPVVKKGAAAKSTPSKASTKSASLSTSQQNDNDELAIQIDTNEFNEDFGEEKTKKSDEEAAKKKVAAEEQQVIKPVVSIPESQIEEKKEIVSEKPVIEAVEKKAEPSKVTFSSKSISSQIGAVISRKASPSDHDDDDDDDEMETRRKPASVASVIKVSERKYTVPKSMQPNKTILLKAVSEANSSVKAKKSSADEKLEEIRSRRRQERSEEARREASPAAKRVSGEDARESRLKRFKRSLSPGAGHKAAKLGLEEGDRRKAVIAEVEADKRVVSASMVFADRRQVQIESHEKFESKLTITKEPKFIVTLNGLSDEKFLKRVQPEEESSRDLDQAMSDGGDEQMESLEINADYENDENMEMADEEKPQSAKKKPIRCSFWPMCDKGEQCQFIHPKKPCTAFPNCPFGQQCHYLHPSCRYDGFCTRADCPFTHVIKKPAPLAEVPTTTTTTTTTSQQAASEITQPAVAPIAQTPETTTSKPTGTPSSNIQPKITINKIQPLYSLVNQPSQVTAQTNPSAIPSKDLLVAKPIPATPTSFPTSYRMMPRAASTTPYWYPSFAANQYSLVNRAATLASTITISCKFGNLCKNPKCIYSHPNLPQKSQLKWSAALANSTNITSQVEIATAKNTADQAMSENIIQQQQQQQQKADASLVQS